MKKHLFLILTILAALCISFTGCGDTAAGSGSPELAITINGGAIENGATIDIGSVQVLGTIEVSGTITNNGNGELDLIGFTLTGDYADSYDILSSPDMNISAGDSTDFQISISVGTSTGSHTNVLSITNNDSNESAFTIILGSTTESREWSQVTENADWSARYRHKCLVYDEDIWLLGGYDGSSFLGDVWIFNEDSGWAKQSTDTLWSGRDVFGSVVYNDKIWVLGGYGYTGEGSESGYLNDVWSYDEGVWTHNTDASWSGRSDFGCVVFNDKIWVLGGYINGCLNEVWSYDEGSGWNQSNDPPWSKRSNFGCVVFDDKIWVLGGYSSSGYCNDVWYSRDGDNWTQVVEDGNDDYWEGRGYLGSVVYNNMLWVLGGYSNDYEELNDIWYSSDGESWTVYDSDAAWDGRESMDLLVYNDKIWIFGGYSDSGYLDDVWSW